MKNQGNPIQGHGDRTPEEDGTQKSVVSAEGHRNTAGEHKNRRNTVWKRVKQAARSVFVRRKYKDELFRYVFNDKGTLLELYNALNGTDYQDERLLEIYTIEDVIYMGYKNDISFIVSGVLNLYEHQSSINPNMPLRGLLYFARQYEAYIKQHHLNIYGTALVKIPLPQYLIFYNGADGWMKEQDCMELRLTDAFQSASQDGITPCLQCTARVYNINYGHNKKLMEQCRTLRDYAIFVGKVMAYTDRGYPLEAAVDTAVLECIEEDVLADFLQKHRAEVAGMLLEEFDMKEFLKMDRRDQYAMGKRDGEREGWLHGKAEGRIEGRTEGRIEGRAEGRKEGRTEGRIEGKLQGQTQSILLLLSELGDLPSDLQEQITGETDSAVLEIWLRAAAHATSIEDFRKQTVVKL